jgi:phosphoadenosine phosphosulfate reductase
MSTPSLEILQQRYGHLPAGELLHGLIHEALPGRVALVSSFGADSALLLSLVADVDKHTPVLFLNTGKHFPETLEYTRHLTDQLGLTRVLHLTPDETLLSNIDSTGTLWQHQPNRCCWLRKVEPLERAVKELGIEALITGRKRYQTAERAQMHTIELDEQQQLRINPLANWSKEQLQAETMRRNLPPHPLVAQGYKSIGCAPCTRQVAAGEDERAGRWAHTKTTDSAQKTECGLHVTQEH